MNLKSWCVVLFLTLVLIACEAEPSPTPTSAGDVHGKANVEQVEVLILESMPVQVMVVARGNLPDGCTEIDDISVERQGQSFEVTITTLRPAGALCTQALVPFEERVPLDVEGLEAGRYMVDVNGVQETFELSVDNVSPIQAIHEGKAPVQSVRLSRTDAAHINVMISGDLPDGCTKIGRVSQTWVDERTLKLEVFTERPVDKACTEALVPFGKTIQIETENLEPGIYTVNVNGETSEFVIRGTAEPPPVDKTKPEPGTAEPEDVIVKQAPVESVEVVIDQGSDVPLYVVARGNLPDGCTEIDTTKSTQAVQGNQITIELLTKRPAGMMCTTVLSPFEERIPVDVDDLSLGDYTVSVNGVRTSFTWPGKGTGE